MTLPPIVFKRPAKVCPHPHWEVDMEQPDLTCAECGAQLDPYWCLRRFAQDAQRQQWRLDGLLEVEKRAAHKREQAKRRRAGIRTVPYDADDQ